MGKHRTKHSMALQLLLEAQQLTKLPFHERFPRLISILGEEKVRRWERAFALDDESFDVMGLFEDIEDEGEDKIEDKNEE